MEGNSKTAHKIWIALGVVTILSGIYLTVQGTYIPGISGSLVGVWLAYENYQKLKSLD